METSQLSLLTKRRFLPLFLVQFLGAFNDNLLRSGLVVLISYASVRGIELPVKAEILVTLCSAMLVLPFLLFSSIAGPLADKYEKSLLIKLTKYAEVFIMLGAFYGFSTSNIYLLMVMLFISGTHSTFFGPMKFSILPDHLTEKELLAGNGLIAGATFIAILTGLICGGLLVEQPNNAVGFAAVGVALTGLIISYFIPKAAANEPHAAINLRIIHNTANMLRYAAKSPPLFYSILGLSWFMLVGSVFMSQFPNYAKQAAQANSEVYTLFLTVFSVGIAIGSSLCNRLLKGEISARYTPLAGVFVSVFTLAMVALTPTPQSAELMDVQQYLHSNWQHWAVLFCLLMVAISGGIYMVPLYAILQSFGESSHRSRVIACSNIMDSLFMTVASVVCVLLLAAGLDVLGLFVVLALGNFVVALFIFTVVPDLLVKTLLKGVLKLCFRVRVSGLEHYEKAGERCLIVANHQSFLDAALLIAFLPGKPAFAMNVYQAEKWYFKPLLRMFTVYQIDPTKPMSTKSLISNLKQAGKVVIFPEGRITLTGSLMKIYDGTGMIIDKSAATILPVRIEGAQYSRFSRMGHKLRRRWFPRIELTILPPTRLDIPDTIAGRTRRKVMGRAVYHMMADMMFDSSPSRTTLLEALHSAQEKHGPSHIIAQDATRSELTYRQLFTRILLLAKALREDTKDEATLGLMLPNSLASLSLFFACHAAGKTPAMINFSAGQMNILHACQIAKIKTLITSRQFVSQGRMQEVVDILSQHVRIIYLEDWKTRFSAFTKWKAYRKARLSQSIARKAARAASPDSPAAILFTSGSEGMPKGVVLSHANILANIYQAAAKVDFNPSDVLFNAMPMFHSFGLTVGNLLPVLNGIRVFLYPSPLHYRIIPEVCYDISATIMLGTDTFLNGYARHANSYDFYSVRFVVAGAERLKDETRKTWSEKFQVPIFEGYGATEMSPVIAVNTPMENRYGTVGQFLPGIAYRLEKVEGIEGAGRLFVKGPNQMLGYLKADKPGEIQPYGEWYDTGDIVRVDEDGFVSIRGRAKRFAKIGGEMVSLQVIEDAAASLWPDYVHAAVTIADEKKGEQIILITECDTADKEHFIAHAKQCGIAEIAMPRKLLVVNEMPLLGSGKTDYPRLQAMLNEAS